MNYELTFNKKALKEWRKLTKQVQQQFKKKLAERLKNPKIPSAKLKGLDDCYKIKLKTAGYRLLYKVEDNDRIIIVLIIGKRENNEVYNHVRNRLV